MKKWFRIRLRFGYRTNLCRYHIANVLVAHGLIERVIYAYLYSSTHDHTNRIQFVDLHHERIWYATVNSTTWSVYCSAGNWCENDFAGYAHLVAPVCHSFPRILPQRIWMAAPNAPLLYGNIIYTRIKMVAHTFDS